MPAPPADASPSPATAPAPSLGPVASISCRGITKVFGRHRALAGVSMRLQAGRACALLGHNGAGKSTLISILSTLARPSAGQVDLGAEDPVEARARIGVLAHDSFLYGELGAVENLRFYASLYDLDDVEGRITRRLREVGLDERAWHRPARTFSRGMLQRLTLARTLLHDPAILLLDEPFTGLDRSGTRALGAAIHNAAAEGRIVLVTTHDLEAIDGLCRHVVILAGGKVVHDETADEPFSRAALAERAYAHLG